MNSFQINDNWRVVGGMEEDEVVRIDFPCDALIFRNKDFSRADGNRNGFYRSENLCVQKRVEFPKAEKLFLELEGAREKVDVYVGADCIATVTDSAKYLADVTEYAGSTHNVTLSFSSSENASKYTGLGLSGGIKFVSAGDCLYVAPDGVCVATVSNDLKAELLCRIDVVNDGDAARSVTALVQAFNARGRRITKKARKLRIQARTAKSFYVPVRLTRRYDWSFADPYLYSLSVTLDDEGETVDIATVGFGIRRMELEKGSLLCDGRKTRIRGVVAKHDNFAVGAAAFDTAEAKKAALLKECGFNAVRYVGVPAEAALTALDRAGLMCVVDLFDTLSQPKSIGDGHEYFKNNYERVVESSVKTLRKHPCVIAYGIADCPSESYGRGEGATYGKEIVELIKKYDDTRFTIASAAELVPSAEEMIKLGVRPDKVRSAEHSDTMLSLSREKNAFRDLTADWFALADVAGYANLHQRYQSDMLAAPKNIIGTASRADKVFEIIDETDSNGVLGDFVCALDGLGGADKGDGFAGNRCTVDGDIDITGKTKPRSIYRKICMGARNKSVIVVSDPECEDDETESKDGWNLPRFLGKPVTVKVFTGGDVVALYLDGKLVGRKLAGRINKYIATFKVNYYPGKLEAVSFRKGVECSRCSLETASSPKALKLVCDDKKVVLSQGNMAFVEILVTDKEGRAATRAQREVEVTVGGDGELYALTNADPELSLPASVKTISVYEGRALAVVRGTGEGKMTVKVTGDGLLSNKITIKVKP